MGHPDRGDLRSVAQRSHDFGTRVTDDDADVEKRHVPVALDAHRDELLHRSDTAVALDGSEYLATEHDLVAGGAPPIDLALESRVQACVLEAIAAGLVRSAHDCSDGGLAVTLAEAAIAGPVGATLDVGALATTDMRLDELLFGEGASRIVLEVNADRIDDLAYIAARHDAPLTQLGRTGGDDLVLAREDEPLLRVPVTELATAWTTALPRLMNSEPHT